MVSRRTSLPECAYWLERRKDLRWGLVRVVIAFAQEPMQLPSAQQRVFLAVRGHGGAVKREGTIELPPAQRLPTRAVYLAACCHSTAMAWLADRLASSS